MEDLTEMSAIELQRWDGKDWEGEPVEVVPDELVQHVRESFAARGWDPDRAERHVRWFYASGRQRELEQRLELGLPTTLPRSQGRAFNWYVEHHAHKP